jgi:RNA polymerase sigma-70 factor (ECF subfamily)
MTAPPPPAPPDSGSTDASAEDPRPGAVDFQLVQRTVAGDQRAFELLVIKYQRRIERLIGRMVRDVDLVEDIAQETFIRAYRALHQFRGDAQFYTWLYRIAVNTAKKALVDMKRDPTISESALRSSSDDDDETSRPGNEPISDETPESVLAAKEIGNAVEAAMEALPAELRQAVTLREIEGMSYEEIAEVMNCPIGTVRSRIFRAREAISARVKPLLDNQSGKRW